MDGKILLSPEELEKTALEFDYREIHESSMLIQKELHKTERETEVLNAQHNQLISWRHLRLSLDTSNITDTVRYIFLTGAVGRFDYCRKHLYKKFPLLYCEKISEHQKKENVVFICFNDQEKEILEECKKLGVEKVDLFNLKGTVSSNLERISNELRKLKIKHETLEDNAAKLTPHLNKLKVVYDYFFNLNQRIFTHDKFVESRN